MFTTKIILIAFLIFLIFLTGCKLFDLGGFVLPDDDEFVAIIDNLDTPRKICQYMAENFIWNWSIHTYSPYQMYLANLEDWNDTGDCDDFATFAVFVANYHGYKTYRMNMWLKFTGLYDLPLVLPHVLGVFVENGKYTYSDEAAYIPLFANSFEEIIINFESYGYPVISWKVYDYNNNLVGGN